MDGFRVSKALNHFDNPNPGGPMYAYDDTGKLLYEDGGDWILAALGQINQNRGAYGAAVLEVVWITRYPNISEKIGRLGQNLHVLADFYAHTNWVDGADRGGCFEAWSQQGYVPEGMARTDVWDEQPGYGQIFSGTVNDPLEVLAQDGTPYTHAYWAKDSPDDVGGEKKLDGARRGHLAANGQYFWQATTFTPKNLADILGKDKENKNIEPKFGENYITDDGKPPTSSGQRIYVRKPIANQYDLAMSLAIEHTVKEIKRFYAASSSVDVGGQTMRDVLKMSDSELSEKLIQYKGFPDKGANSGE